MTPRSKMAGRVIAALAVVLSPIAAASAQPVAGEISAPRLKPPPPEPAHISRADLERIRILREALKRRRFAEAARLFDRFDDPAAKSLAQWYYFEAEDPFVSIVDADAFLDLHPEWPSVSKIQSHVERRMNWTTPVSIVLAFFESRDPILGEGKMQLARAQFATGAGDAAELHVKDAWINNDFTLADENKVLAQYGSRLGADDHAARADRLLWAREATAALRIFPRLPSDERRRAEARAALIQQRATAERLYGSLSAEDRADPGVALAAVRYFRRKEEEPRALAIVRAAPLDPAARENPPRWWYEQQLLMRWALKERQYADAYAMAAQHGLEPGSVEFAEAEFDAGWIALRFLNDPARAETHFAALTASVSAPISLARGWYWLARAAEAKGEPALAGQRFGLAANHIYTFYGQLAAERIDGEAATVRFQESPPATAEEKARFHSRPGVAALRMLTDIGDERAFLIFAYHIDDQLRSRGEVLELGELSMRIGAPHIAVRAGKAAIKANAFAPEVAYPTIYVPAEATRYVPEEVILGLSRQESEFNPRAYSPAGARGVMQLLPSTAEITARKAGLSYRRDALLGDSSYNMTIGSAHLSQLFDRFDGSWALAFAAYNAGPHRAAQWIEEYGDPRSPGVDALDWLEKIPFEETRNYVQRVFENTQIYRSRINGAPIAGSLARDIQRGGPGGRIALEIDAGPPPDLPALEPRIIATAAPILAAPAIAAEEAPTVGLKPQPAPAPSARPRAAGPPASATPASAAPEAGPDFIDLRTDDPRANEARAPDCAPVEVTAAAAGEASADDLNAGMLAEMRNPACR